MDTDNQQVVLPSTSTSESPLPKYTFKRPFRQCFSLPYTIIKYMIRNPQSGKVWTKLIMSCKYFYPKYSVLPVKDLKFGFDMKLKADGKIFDSSKPFPKLWLYDSFFIYGALDISNLISKIFKFDLRVLFLFNQSLKIQDYQKLTSSGFVEGLNLSGTEIKDADGAFFTADKLLKNFKHLKSLTIVRPNPLMFQPGTIKKMVQHFDRFENMRSFGLWGIKQSFDFSSFVDFLMENKTVDTHLYFNPVSAAYKEMLEIVVKEIKKNPSLKIPRIVFLNKK